MCLLLRLKMKVLTSLYLVLDIRFGIKTLVSIRLACETESTKLIEKIHRHFIVTSYYENFRCLSVVTALEHNASNIYIQIHTLQNYSSNVFALYGLGSSRHPHGENDSYAKE